MKVNDCFLNKKRIVSQDQTKIVITIKLLKVTSQRNTKIIIMYISYICLFKIVESTNI